MASINRWAIGLIPLLVGGGVLWARDASPPDDPPASPPVLWAIPTGLRDGDLILRRGTDLVAAAVIASGRGSRFSHVGVIVIEEGRPFVIHALPPDATDDGVRREPLERFLAPSQTTDVAIFRIAELSLDARDRLRTYVRSRLDAPFDARFRFSDDAALYCTELVLKGFQAAGIDLTIDLPRVAMVTLAEPAYAPDALRKIRGLRSIPLLRSVPPAS